MRLIATILLLLAAVAAYGQEIQGTRGITYTDGVPTHTPSSLASLVAIDLNTGIEYRYAGGSWRVFDMGFVLTGTTGAPGWTPDFNDPYMAANAGDSLYHYRSGAWHLASGALPDLSAYLQWSDTTSTIATKSDLAAVDGTPQTIDTFQIVTVGGPDPLNELRLSISDDGQPYKSVNLLPYLDNTDNQVISIDSSVGSSVKYYTATLEDGGTISWRDSFPSGSALSGGVANYVLQYTSATAADTTGLYWNPTTGRLGIRTASPTVTLNVVGPGSTSATPVALFENSSGTDILQVEGDGDIKLNGAMTIGYGEGNVSTNLAFGTNALASNTTGGENVAIGANALRYNIIGSTNIAIGSRVLENVNLNDNIAIGWGAMISASGSKNTIIGNLAMGSNTRVGDVANTCC